MKLNSVKALFALLVSCGLFAAAPAVAKPLQCAPYARQISGIEIRGNANTWWSQAAGRYARGHAPRVGAVLAFAATRGMRMGHVAMVSRVISDREVLLTHANWSHRGGIERDVRAIDVSPNGDWSMVKVWFAPLGDLGRTAYPAQGFIYADGVPQVEQEAPRVPMVIAQAPTTGAGVISTTVAYDTPAY